MYSDTSAWTNKDGTRRYKWKYQCGHYAKSKFGQCKKNAISAEWIEAEVIEYTKPVSYTHLGKVDIGGGGTIAYILSLYGMQVIDSGVAVLNMHAPWEITSKADVYEAKKCYAAFLKAE